TSSAGPTLPSHKEVSGRATDDPAESSPSVPGVGSEGLDVALLGSSTDSAESTLTPPTTTPPAAGVTNVVQTPSSDVPRTLPPSPSGEPALLEYRSSGRVDALQSSEVAAPSEEPLETGGGSGRTFARDQSAVLAAEAPRSGRGNNGQLPEYDFENPSSGGTNVYIIAIIGLVPAAGAVIWCVRKALSKGDKASGWGRQISSLNEGEVPATAPAEDKESGHETPTKYAYVQEAYNREYGKVISQLVATVLHLDAEALTVAEYANNDEKRDLIREMQVMRELGKHPNVVEFLGCCTRDVVGHPGPRQNDASPQPLWDNDMPETMTHGTPGVGATNSTRSKLSSDLDSLIKLNAGYIDLDNFPEHAYCNVYYGVDEKL
ncbi:hypothetical protein IscW_ISCW006904, partial [Ixodes scapularis]